MDTDFISTAGTIPSPRADQASRPGVLPDLLHQTAFNLCAVLACFWGRPARLIAGNPFYRAELARRLELCPDGEAEGRHPVLVWADPRLEARAEVADSLGAFLSGGAVVVLARGRAGWRRVFGVENAGGPESPEGRPLGLEEALSWLAVQGFQEVACYGIGGPRYRFWSRLARIVESLGRGDLADRFRARARSALLVEDRQARTSLLALAIVRGSMQALGEQNAGIIGLGSGKPFPLRDRSSRGDRLWHERGIKGILRWAASPPTAKSLHFPSPLLPPKASRRGARMIQCKQ